jgi:predicted aspartyl protease
VGVFYTSCRIENHVDPKRTAEIPYLIVDTGSECTWILRSILEGIGVDDRRKTRTFSMADGRTITRPVGYVILRVGGDETTDEVVFAEPGDLQLLGARTLEGLGLRVDPVRKMLVPAGPVPAAVA